MRKEQVIKSRVVDFMSGPEYADALNSDFEEFDENEYLSISSLLREQIYELGDYDFFDDPDGGKDFYNRVISAPIIVSNKKSKFRKVILKFLNDEIESFLFSFKTAARKNIPLRVSVKPGFELFHDCRMLNFQIIDVFRERTLTVFKKVEIILKLVKENFDILDLINISTILYNLKFLTIINSGLIKNLLLILARKINESNEEMDKRGVGNSLYGLKGLSEVPDELLLALANKINDSKCEMDAQGIGNALYGLQGLSEVPDELLLALANKINESKCEMDGQGIGNALYGLRGLSDVPNELLLAIAKKINDSNCEMKGQHIGNALYGLRSMSSVPDELLLAIAKKINDSNYEMDEQGVGNSLFGLQGVSEVPDELFSVLFEKMKNLKGELSGRGIEKALYGLLGKEGGEAKQMQDYLFQKFEENNCSDIKLSEIDIVCLKQLYSWYGREIPSFLDEKYLKLAQVQELPSSNLECKAATIILRNFPWLDFEANKLIDGFELDIYFDGLDVNLEIDGPSHSFAVKKLRNKRRDEYLENNGIKVIRISCYESDFEDALIKKINALIPSYDSRYDFPVRYSSV